MKQLYVCVTRPKKRLLIYDEDPSKRGAVLNYWLKLDVVDKVTEEMLRGEDTSHLSEEQVALLSKMREGTSSFASADELEHRKKGWRSQGIKMFKRRYYEQAVKCFEHSGDADLRQRAMAYGLAEDASRA